MEKRLDKIALRTFFNEKESKYLDEYENEDVRYAFIYRVKDFIEKERQHATFKSIDTEVNSLFNDAKMLLSKDPFLSLSGLKEFLVEQSSTLKAVRNKISDRDVRFLIFVNSIIHIALFDIEESLRFIDYKKCRNSYAYNFYRCSCNFEINLMDIIKMLDKIDVYGDELYKNKRKEFIKLCSVKNVYCNTTSDNNANSNNLGCFTFVIILFYFGNLIF